MVNILRRFKEANLDKMREKHFFFKGRGRSLTFLVTTVGYWEAHVKLSMVVTPTWGQDKTFEKMLILNVFYCLQKDRVPSKENM